MPGLLVDTNIFVYLYDRQAPDKQAQALSVLDHLAQEHLGVVSTQVLAEFFWVVTRKLADPLTIKEAIASVNRYLDTWIVLDVTADVIREACRGVQAYQLSYWDAQIWAVANLHQISIVLSEDFQDNQRMEGVRFLNPFTLTFKLEDWLSQ